MNKWYCNKYKKIEREVSCSWKDQNEGACVTRNNEWCPFFEERKKKGKS